MAACRGEPLAVSDVQGSIRIEACLPEANVTNPECSRRYNSVMDRPTYSFAGVELDTARCQIRGKDVTVEPPPLVFKVLEAMASRGNRVVSKEELSDILWPNRVVTEASISQVIRKARVALEECGADPGVLKTQHGHGYRLDAAVSISESDDLNSEWQKHPLRTGAIVALLGGILVTLANISDVLQWVVPDDSVEMLQETQTTIESTDAKVDEVVRLLRQQAALSGKGLDPDSENTIRAAVATIVNSVDARKRSALDQLSEGNVEAAADAIVAVAGDLDTASVQSVVAAAESWREAGAIYYTSNIDKAINSYESAHRLRPDDSPIANELAFAYLRAGRYDDAASLFGQNAMSARSAQSRSDALRGAGIVLMHSGDFDEASDRFAQALDAADTAEDRRRRSLVLLQQGEIARARGNNDVALAKFRSAVDYAEEIGDQHLLAQTLNKLGIIMAVLERFEQAERILNSALDIHVARHDSAGRAEVLGDLGAIALLQDDADTAEAYLQRSVAIGDELGWQRSVAMDLINLGTIAASRREFDTAGERLERALEIAVTAGLDEIHPIILANMGELARETGDPEKACRLWQEALSPLKAMEHTAVQIVMSNQEALGCTLR